MYKNVFAYDPYKGIPDFDVPVYTKPEWYFTESELKYVKDKGLSDYVLFHPVSSDFNNVSRNISFGLIEKCAKYFDIVMVQGGCSYLPVDGLRRMEAKMKLLWEGYNCSDDEYGHPLGKLLALTSECKASVHGWSGSFTMSMGYNKPYVVVIPMDKIRCNVSAPYRDGSEQFTYQINRAGAYGCLNPSAWCMTDSEDVVTEAVGYVLEGKTAIYNKSWKFIE